MTTVSDVVLYIGVPKRWRFDGESREAGAFEIVKDICEMSEALDFCRYDGTRDQIAIDWLDETDSDPVAADYWHREYRLLPTGFLRLRSRISIGDAQLRPWLETDVEGMTQEDAVHLYLESVADSQYRRWRDVAVASHLARPGALTFHNSFSYFAERRVERDGGVSIFLGPKRIAQELAWPTIRTLPLRQVWAWLNRLKGFDKSLAEGKTGRAVGALTHLVNTQTRDENVLALVWGLLGLEALYGEGNVGMRSQLLQKSEAFLGKRLSHTKQFGWMYDYRSRFLHGDLDFTFKHHDGTDSGDQFHDELGKATDLAGAMLLATVQEMCFRGIEEIAFEYVLRGK